MKRNSFLQEKIDEGIVTIPLNNRGTIHDCTSTLFNTLISLPAIEKISHSHPTLWAPFYIYLDSCRGNFPNSDFLFSRIIDFIEVIYDQNNYCYTLTLENFNIQEISDNEKHIFTKAIKSLNPDANYQNYQLIYAQLPDENIELIGITSPFTLVIPIADIDQTKFYQTYPQYFKEIRTNDKREKHFLAYLKNISNQIAAYISENKYDSENGLNIFRQKLDQFIGDQKLPAFNIKDYEATGFVNIFNICLAEKNETSTIDSRYLIKPNESREVIGKLPLALAENLSGNYYSFYQFPQNFKIDDANRNELPYYKRKYEWINPLKDFLEDYIILFDYNFDSQFLYSPLSGRELNRFLMPLKIKFFDFFTPDDLSNLFDLKISPDNSTYTVTLRIPRNYAEPLVCEKKYFKNAGKISADSGRVIEYERGSNPFFALWPSFNQSNLKNYYFFEMSPLFKEFNCNYFSEIINNKKTRLVKQIDYEIKSEKRNAAITTSRIQGFPNVVEFVDPSRNNATGIFVVKPNSPTSTQPQKVFVAIDFGTTNSNVAIHIVNVQKKIFEYSDKNFNTIVTFNKFNQEVELHKAFDKSIKEFFIPASLANKKEVDTAYIPIPSLLLEYTNTNVSISHKESIVNINIPFYGLNSGDRHNKLESEFKWGEKNDYIKLYIQELLIIIKSFLSYNNYSLNNTTLLISFPLAYIENRRENYKKTWKELSDSFQFGHIDFLDESTAIQNYFSIGQGQNLDLTNKNYAFLDIGGGTTDICIKSSKHKDYSTNDSFLLGGRDIIGHFGQTDEVPSSPPQNPIVRHLENVLNSNGDELDAYRNSNFYKNYYNSQMKFTNLLNSKAGGLYPNIMFNTNEFDYLKIIMAYFLSIIIYYLGLFFRSKEYDNQNIDTIFVGGNTSRFLDWLVLSDFNKIDSNHKSVVLDYLNKIFYLGRYGIIPKEKYPKFEFVKSEEPKNEIVLGVTQYFTKNIVNGLKTDFKKLTLSGENIICDGEKLKSNDLIDKPDPNFVQQGLKINDIRTLDIQNLENCELYKFNSGFCTLLKGNGVTNPHQLFKFETNSIIRNQSFIDSIEKILLDKSNYATILRNEVQGYFNDVGDSIFSSSFFILSAKGLLHRLIDKFNDIIP